MATNPVGDYWSRQNEEARFAHCIELWRAVRPERRIPLLLEVLDRYRQVCGVRDVVADADPEDASEGKILSYEQVNDLVISAYRLISSRERKQLCMEPTEAQSLLILRRAYHVCGHGEDTEPPVKFALRHFRKRLYSEDFFDALRSYREVLAHTRQTVAARLKVKIDFILWQDLRQSPKNCWSERIHCGLKTLPASQQTLWRMLFQRFVASMSPEPPQRWNTLSAIEAIGKRECASRLLDWMGRSGFEQENLTTSGSYVLKNLIWLATILEVDELDESLQTLLFCRWKKRQPLDKVALALAYLWSRNDGPHSREVGPDRIGRIMEEFPVGYQVVKFWNHRGGKEQDCQPNT